MIIRQSISLKVLLSVAVALGYAPPALLTAGSCIQSQYSCVSIKESCTQIGMAACPMLDSGFVSTSGTASPSLRNSSEITVTGHLHHDQFGDKVVCGNDHAVTQCYLRDVQVYGLTCVEGTFSTTVQNICCIQN
jgi:hypothetical protein